MAIKGLILHLPAWHNYLIKFCELIGYYSVVLAWLHSHYGGALLVYRSVMLRRLRIVYFISFLAYTNSTQRNKNIDWIVSNNGARYDLIIWLLLHKRWDPNDTLGWLFNYMLVCAARTSSSGFGILYPTWRWSGSAHESLIHQSWHKVKGCCWLMLILYVGMGSRLFDHTYITLQIRLQGFLEGVRF